MMNVIYAECHYGKCLYGKCHYAECHGALYVAVKKFYNTRPLMIKSLLSFAKIS
jgi:hypothetical protein